MEWVRTPAARAEATPADTRREGVVYGLAAYLLWGAFPLFFPLLEPAAPVEILAHRIVWSLAAGGGVLGVRRGGGGGLVAGVGGPRGGELASRGAGGVAPDWGAG